MTHLVGHGPLEALPYQERPPTNMERLASEVAYFEYKDGGPRQTLARILTVQWMMSLSFVV